jgi:DNA-binding transcriptional ArsR family regulator
MLDPAVPLPEDLAALIAARFAALAEPNRVRILDTLQREGELSVSEIAQRLNAGYANVAKHLSLLHRERIVSRAKDGTRAVYRITDPSIARLCDEVCGAIAQQHAELSQLLAGHQLTSVTTDTHEEKNR